MFAGSRFVAFGRTFRLVVAAVAAFAAFAGVARAGTLDSAPLTFDGTFQSGLTPWYAAHGAVQCANYGTVSQNGILRGNFYVDSSNAGGIPVVGRFDLPPSQLPTYPKQACELLNPRPIGVGSDDYYGYTFYVPTGWDSGTSYPYSFWGITIAQFHYELIWGAPIEFELHNDHVTLAVQTGACNTYLSSSPGCTWHSNADSYDPGNLGALYVVPSPMKQGVWHEVMMHVHWALNNTGQIQVYHRVKGQTTWTKTASVSGIPTLQWVASTGYYPTSIVEKNGAYRANASTPVSVWENDILIGSSFGSIAKNLP